jgi:hypothetical protein
MKHINDIVYTNYKLEYPVADIANDLDWKTILSRPPLNDSDTTISELEDISKYTLRLSEANKILVYNIDDNPNFLLYPFLEKNNIKFSFDYFRSIYRIIRPILLNIKYFYNRPRPYDLGPVFDISIKVLHTETHHTPAYPSGHTVYTSLACDIIKKQYDDSKIHRGLDNIVQTTAECRMMQGVHYYSDNQASIKLTNLIYNHLYNKMESNYYG